MGRWGGVGWGVAHTQTWSTTGQSEVFGDLQDLKVTNKTRVKSASTRDLPDHHPSGYCLPPCASSSPSGLSLSLLLWTEMGRGTREGESQNLYPLPLHALVGSGNFPSPFCILLCRKTAANGNWMKIWVGGLIYFINSRPAADLRLSRTGEFTLAPFQLSSARLSIIPPPAGPRQRPHSS